MSKEINLIKNQVNPNEVKTTAKLTLRTFAFIILFGVSFLSIVLFTLIALSPLPQLQEREADEKKNLTVFRAKIARLAVAKERASAITAIMNTRHVYTKDIAAITALIPGKTTVDGIKLENKIVTLTVSSNSLEYLDHFLQNVIDTYKDKKTYAKITVNSLLLNDDLGRYVMQISFTGL